MIDSLARNLDYFRQELRDLKTSHAIPVGSLNFYQHTGTATTTGFFSGLYVRLTIKAGEPTYPYSQVFVGRTTDGTMQSFVQYQSVEEDGTIIQYYFSLYQSDFNVIAICTSNFDLTVKQFEDSDWIGDMPEES